MTRAKQVRVVSQASPNPNQGLEETAFFDEDGDPVEFGGDRGPVEWSEVTGKPATFPPTIGTTATTAKAGNAVTAWADVTGKPATFPPVIGTTSTTAKAGDAVQSASETPATPISPGSATDVQGILAELAARVAALEDAGD